MTRLYDANEPNPAEEGIMAARADARNGVRSAAKFVMIEAIQRLTSQIEEAAAYLEQNCHLAAIGSLDGFDEQVANIKAARTILLMAERNQ